MAQPKPRRAYTQVVTGPSDIPTYCVYFSLAPTVAMDIITAKLATAVNKVLRLRRFVIDNPGQQGTAASVQTIRIGFVTDTGSGGSVFTPANAALAEGDPDSTFVAQVGDTTQAPGFVTYMDLHVFVPLTTPAAFTPLIYDFDQECGLFKPPTVLAVTGTATPRAINIRHPGATTASGFSGHAIFTEEAFDPSLVL